MIRRVAPFLLLLISLAPFDTMLLRRELPTFRDHLSYFLPLRWHTAAVLRGGELPLWNPWNGMGEPWLANPQTGVFYPPTWLIAFLPFETGYVLFLALHLALLGFGAWRLFARWASEGPALLAAGTLMLSGPVISLLDVNNNLASLAWLPLVITLALNRPGERDRPLLLGFALAMAFLAGEPLYAAVAAGITAVILVSSRRWWSLAIAAGISAGLAAVQILPFLAWIHGSDRSEGLAAEEAFAQAMAPGDWLNLALSNAAADGAMQPLSMSQSFIPSMALGFPIVLFALSAIVAAGRGTMPERRRVVTFLLLAFAAVMILSALPRIEGIRDLLTSVRFNAIRYPARFIPLGAIALAGLAAIGLDRATVHPLGWRVALMLSLVVLGGLRLFLVEDPLNPTTSLRLAIFLGWTVALGLMFVAFPRWLGKGIVQAILLVVVAEDHLASARPLLTSAPSEIALGGDWGREIEPPWKATRVPAEGDRSAARRPRSWMAGYLNLYDRHFDLGTAAPVIDRSALDFYRRLQRGDRADLIDAASVRWLLTTRESLPDRYRDTGVVHGRVRLWENPAAEPVARVVSGRIVDDAGRALLQAWIRHPRAGWDLASADPSVPSEERLLRATGRPSAISFGVRSMEVTLAPQTRGILLLSQRWERGWKVNIDGRERKPLVANGLFAAVAVEPGDRTVEWTYLPSTLIAGFAISVMTVICIIVVVARQRIRSKMRGPDAAEERGEGVISSSIAASQDFHRKTKTSKTVVILSSAPV